MLSDRCLSVCQCVCLSVCDVGVLWPNGWMDQDETWQAGRPRPWHIVLDGDPAPPLKKGGRAFPQFSTHVCCGQTAGWIKMSLGTEVDLSTGHIVLDGDLALPAVAQQTPSFGPCLLRPRSPISATAELLCFAAFMYAIDNLTSGLSYAP